MKLQVPGSSGGVIYKTYAEAESATKTVTVCTISDRWKCIRGCKQPRAATTPWIDIAVYC
jgi:hypothetical protein